MNQLSSNVVGVDIGGANLKLANAVGQSRSKSFPMWTDRVLLAERIDEMLTSLTSETNRVYDRLAVTMTGEMADCFATRRDGVRYILDQLSSIFPEENTAIYAVDGSWKTPAAARIDPWAVAASNWAALANWIICRPSAYCQNLSLVLDIGSTTVDIIPINSKCIATQARTDSERLRLRQLVYTGVGRTPIAAILQAAVIEGVQQPLVAERFATSDDAYLVLGLVGEVPDDCNSADGQPRTRHCASARLARMLGEDLERLANAEVEQLAMQVVDAQARQIAGAIAQNLRHLETNTRPVVVVSGHGRPLLDRVLIAGQFDAEFVYLEDSISPDAARCAPAVAVAWLLAHADASL